MCGSDGHPRSRKRAARILFLAFTAMLVGSCVPYELRTILDGPKGKALSLTPATIVLPANGTVTFAADGGVPPYVYSIVSGGGTINASTGAYVAPIVAGSATAMVTDKTGKSAQATITIEAFPTSLVLIPAALSLQVGSNVTFAAVGGKPPYTYAMQTSGSGTPSVNAATGAYVAGTTPGTDVVKVTDAASATATATVTVTNLTSSVDYTIPSVSFPATGTASTAIPGGYSFTLENSGSAPGTQTVTWKLFLSSNTVVDGGDMMIGTGTTSPVAAGASVPVSITGTFPGVPAGAWYLIAQVQAPDDTTPANNTSGAGAITLSPMNIDYTVTGVASTGATISGGPLSGTVSLSNVGTANGTSTVEWAVYASLDTVLDGSDYLLARGTIAGLAAGAGSGAIAFSGYWPSTPNTWNLIAEVSATDDVGPGNNTRLGGPVTVSGPPPADINYTVVSVSSTGGTVAGDSLAGSFSAQNIGAVGGGQPVTWTAYLSSDATLQIGTDPVIDSGSFAALTAGASSGTITFSGTWPSGPGSWRLIVAISASDDINSTNNVTASGSYGTSAPNVDYTPQNVQSTGGTTAGSALAGSFIIHNSGTHAGSQFIPWAVYLSADATLSVGTDQLLETGSVPAPGLAAGADSSTITFAGTWPSANTVKTWYLIAAVGAGDDVNATNNAAASASSITVNPPNIDYTIPVAPGPGDVRNTGGTTSGGPITGTFTINNIGTATGTATVIWTAYVSSNQTWELTDTPISSGTIGPLAGGATSGTITISGTWPGVTATWYLLVKLSAPDDVNSANDVQASGAIAVTGLSPAYSITAVPLPTGTNAYLPVSGTFTIQNVSTTPGVSAINWQIYASLGDNVYNAGDILLASGSIASGLAAGATSSPAWAGTWPSTTGTYYVVVRAAAADAPPIADAASGSVVVTNPPPPDYTATFDPGIPWSGQISTAMSATGTCQVTIQNIAANAGHQNVTWSVYLSTNNILDGGDTLLSQGPLGPMAGLSSTTVSFAGSWPATPGTYYFIVDIVATDDGNLANNTVTAPHFSVTGNYRYKEVEPNGGTGPGPSPITPADDTGVAALKASETIVIEGTMDAFGNYDTYSFTTDISMTRLNIQALWLTGFDDIDVYLWDTGSTNLVTQTTGIDSEPGASTWKISSVTPRTCYVSAYAYLANNTSGSLGKTYVLVVTGKP